MDRTDGQSDTKVIDLPLVDGLDKKPFLRFDDNQTEGIITTCVQDEYSQMLSLTLTLWPGDLIALMS